VSSLNRKPPAGPPFPPLRPGCACFGKNFNFDRLEKQDMKAEPNDLGASEALSRHQRKCTICRHPEREAIEEAFLHWHNPGNICSDYQLGDRRAIYRHAHATGLFERRRDNLRSILEHLLERAEGARLTADTVIRALRAYTCLTDTGRWVEPPTHVIFSMTRPGAAPSRVRSEAVAALALEAGLETPAPRTPRPRNRAVARRRVAKASGANPSAATQIVSAGDAPPLIGTTVIRR
jgi:hypothetical protein